jgi:cysteinyl-tRNA synthetase
VLWKPAKDLDHYFDSPFGKGRPGWHIECSSMSTKFLGNDFDIHGGGVDLIFPHHTNEIAQSCCANPDTNYAKYWIHNGFLTVNGEKMSKSLNNFITINDLLKQGIQGEVIRYVLLSSHYRKPLDWNIKALQDAQKALDNFYNLIDKIEPSISSKNEIPQEFLDCLFDDLNTPKAFAVLYSYYNQYQKTNDQQYLNKLYHSGKLLGFFSKTSNEWFKKSDIDKEFILKQIEIRNQAKKEKNWSVADKIRSDLQSQNIILEDLNDGSTTWKIINETKAHSLN